MTDNGDGSLTLGLEAVPFDHDFQDSEWIATEEGHELVGDNASEGRLLVDGSVDLAVAH